MAAYTLPTKQVVRAYLERRSHDPRPPPSPDDIRRELGWGLVAERAMRPARQRG
jgi:hypothetical protein